jgi:hypothetical protein
VDEEPRGRVVGKSFAKLLGGSSGARMPGDGHVHKAAPLVGQDDEDEQESIRHRRDDKKVGRYDLRGVGGEERSPRR